MKNSIIILSVIISLVIGAGAGYSFRMGSGDSGEKSQKLQDSVDMMKEQSSAIKQMAGMMKTYGTAMQEAGIKYKDDEIISKGKDLEVSGEKYLKDAKEVSGGDDSMKQIMGN
jgi:flagellar basal body-associated protein FliL